MTRILIDRGTPVEGIQKSVRDHRTPHNMVRSMENYRLPDKRLRRRRGFAQYSSNIVRVHGNMLAKHTATRQTSAMVGRTGAGKYDGEARLWATPLSYGLIRYHSDFQPNIGTGYTVEFYLKTGEIEPLLDIITADTTGTTRGFRRIQPSNTTSGRFYKARTIEGVFVYDHTILANDCTVEDNGTQYVLPDETNLLPAAAQEDTWTAFDVVTLPTLAVAYKKNASGNLEIGVEWTIIDSTTGIYYRDTTSEKLTHDTGATYASNTDIHIGITYNATDHKVRLYVDGVLAETSADVRANVPVPANAMWAGETDKVNGRSSRAIQRDIVLLNECTARGNYASTCATRRRWGYLASDNTKWSNHSGSVWKISNLSWEPFHVAYYNATNDIWLDGTEQASAAACTSEGDWAWVGQVFYFHNNSGVTDPATSGHTPDICNGFAGGLNVIPHFFRDVYATPTPSLQIKQPNPWCCSPPRGTGLSELRIWQTQRSAAQILANYLQPIVEGGGWSADLKGYWRLNDGGGVLLDQTDNARSGSTHHGYPQWIASTGLLTGTGLRFGDGQYLIKSFVEQDILYAQDSYRYFKDALHGPTSDYTTNVTNRDPRNDLTIQAQITTPYTFQQNLEYHATLVEDFGPPRFDGREASRYVVSRWRDTAPNAWEGLGNAVGYMQTIFSIEGVKVSNTSPSDTTAKNTRVPLLQGWINENGYLHFANYGRSTYASGTHSPEVFECMAGSSVRETGVETTNATVGNRFTDTSAPFTAGSDGKMAVVTDTTGYVKMLGTITYVDTQNVDIEGLYSARATRGNYTRAVGDLITIMEPLAADTTYVITFRKKSYSKPVTSSTDSDACWLEILVNGTLIMSVAMNNSTMMLHDPDYDVIVGAAFVNDHVDDSVNFADTTNLRGSVTPALMKYSNQHFMGHHQDCPGFFDLGFFRVWLGAALDDDDVSQAGGQTIEDKDLTQGLVVNLEMDQVTGAQVPSRGRYPMLFDLGYKSFGAGPPKQETRTNGIWNSNEAMITLGWGGEDRLGYTKQPANFDNEYDEADCKLLASYNSTLRQQGGVLSVFDDVVLTDPSLGGVFGVEYISGHGLLNDFVPGSKWESTTIGDRAILTSTGGTPKSYNGKVMVEAGIQKWRGGRITGASIVGSAPKLLGDKWYHIRVVYQDEADSLQAVSPPILVKTSTANKAIKIKNIPQHPDPRVTSVRIYRTQGHQTRELAEADTPRLSRLGIFPNKSYIGDDPGIDIDGYEDTNLFPVPLELDIMPVPQGSTSASFNGRLFIAGNPVVPDAYYWSEGGNPEKFLDSSVRILEEGTGDRVIKLLATFGALFVFKMNSIWRVDEVQPGVMQHTKLVEGLGAVAPRAVTVFTVPETGRAMIFFWSRHGPFLFDGINFIYVGQPLEENIDDRSFEWMAYDDLFLLHEIGDREIIVFYKAQTDNITSRRIDRAVVFNYRYSSFGRDGASPVWYEYTGMLGAYATTILLSNAKIAASGGAAQPSGQNTEQYLALIGGDNGMVYKWGSSDYDGLPSETSAYTAQWTISTWTVGTSTLTFTGGPSWNDLRGLWVTIIKADYSDWFTIPVESNSSSTIVLDTGYKPVPFTPDSGDLMYIGRPPAYIKMPWDSLDQPAYNKEIHRILLWFDKDVYYQYSRDWATSAEKTWTVLSDTALKRTQLDLPGGYNCEVMRLELASFETDSRIDAYGFMATPASTEDSPQ